MKYIMQYRCRMCGDVFDQGLTCSEKIAFSTICEITAGVNVVAHYGNPVSVLDAHCTKDHFGIADLIGCKLREEDEEK